LYEFVLFYVNITILVCVFSWLSFFFYIFSRILKSFFLFTNSSCISARFSLLSCFFKITNLAFIQYHILIFFFSLLFLYVRIIVTTVICKQRTLISLRKTKYIYIRIRSVINRNLIKHYCNQTKSIDEYCSMMSNGLISIDYRIPTAEQTIKFCCQSNHFENIAEI
jgi:hypothetical protein